MSGPTKPWVVRFLAASAIWGCSFLFIKVGLRDLVPVQVAFGRTAIGALTMLLALAVTRDRLPRGRTLWSRLFVLGLLWNVVPFVLFAWAETRISSALAGILNATTPLFTMLVITTVMREERLTGRQVVGLFVGFAGVLVVLGPWRGLGDIELAASLACVGATACYGLGYAYTRRHFAGRAESAVALTTGQLLSASVVLAVVTLTSTPAPGTLSLDVIASMIALGALGTGVAYVLNYGLIRDVGPTVASMTTYVIPIFATVAGVVVLSEPLSWNEPLGALVVLSGVALAQGSQAVSNSRAQVSE